jgi:4-hydroxybutyrate dehydrogenase/sulfolactaldehyde 3-reductase
MSTIGFVGLGVMGAPMARNLVRGGHTVRGYDISLTVMKGIAADGVVRTGSAAEAAEGADVVITMLPNGHLVMDAVFGVSGVCEGVERGGLVIDMSTVLPMETDEIGQRLRDHGIAMLDAPVGRSSQHAVDGKLLIMVGGEAADVERARSVLGLLGDTIIHCGALGMGSRMKIVNNFMAIAMNAVTAETLTLAEASGLERDVVLDVLRGTTAGQGHLNTTYPAKVLKGDTTPGFMIDLAAKDLRLALKLAESLSTPVAVGAAAEALYVQAQEHGNGRKDWTVLYSTVRSLAGLE